MNREEMWARVQPGVVQDAFGAVLGPLGLRFGPGDLHLEPRQPRRDDRQQLGGSSLARLWEDGGQCDGRHRRTARRKPRTALLDALGRHPPESSGGRAARPHPPRSAALRAEYSEEIAARFPRIPRRVSGYNLDVLLDPVGVNLAHLVVGSEGTLATVVEARVKLVRKPPRGRPRRPPFRRAAARRSKPGWWRSISGRRRSSSWTGWC